jgi:hypothetical protein
METIWLAIKSTLALPDIWLWLYLIFVISNAMMPSASDRESWWSVVLYLCLALLLVIAFDLVPSLSANLQAFGLTVLTSLLSAFLMTIIVDLIFITFIFIVEGLLSLLLGRRVQYNL